MACEVAASGSYSKRAFPAEGKEAFENYLTENAISARDYVNLDEPSDYISYLIKWADNGKKWREDLRGAWCLFTTSEISLKGGYASVKFVVYETTDRKWGVNPRESIYNVVGCGD
jgi:hypothetical protein